MYQIRSDIKTSSRGYSSIRRRQQQQYVLYNNILLILELNRIKYSNFVGSEHNGKNQWLGSLLKCNALRVENTNSEHTDVITLQVGKISPSKANLSPFPLDEMAVIEPTH